MRHLWISTYILGVVVAIGFGMRILRRTARRPLPLEMIGLATFFASIVVLHSLQEIDRLTRFEGSLRTVLFLVVFVPCAYFAIFYAGMTFNEVFRSYRSDGHLEKWRIRRRHHIMFLMIAIGFGVSGVLLEAYAKYLANSLEIGHP